MQSSTTSHRDRALSLLAAFFILGYFFLFSHDSLHTYFTFDDGMAILPFHHQFEKPIWTNLVEVLKVFTTANRPLGAFFYRPLYRIFGFNPLPFRIVIEILLALNIGLAYWWARTIGASKEAASISTLLFCYNASMVDLYYNCATIYDVLCFGLYIGAMIVYIRGRRTGNPLSARRILWVILLYLLALDSKEMAVTLPGTLLLYEILFRYRDLRRRPVVARSGCLIAALFAASAIFLKVKVAHLSHVNEYAPHVSLKFVLLGYAHYFEQLLYREDGSMSAVTACAILAGLIAAGMLVRSRTAIFGTLFFIAALIPVAIIPPRSGYAAYVAYPGLTLAIGAILASARSQLVRLAGREKWQTATAILLFLCAGAVQARVQTDKRWRGMGTIVWDQAHRIAFMEGFARAVPEFPPDARVLITQDCWGPDWGPMFLSRLLFHNPTLWVDRVKNMDHPPDLASYDILVAFQDNGVDLRPAKLFGISLPWEIRAVDTGGSQFIVSPPNPNRAVPSIVFSPPAVRTGRAVTVTAPGLKNVAIDVMYRILSEGRSQTRVVGGWCTLDANGSCTIAAPYIGQSGLLAVDWIRPKHGRWIYTSGVLTVVE
jgi:hypothetical protein